MTSETKITVNEKEYGLIFGYTAYKRFVTAVGANRDLFYNGDDEFTPEAYVEIIFCAYENYCFDKRRKVELSRDDLNKWIDEKYQTEEGKKVVNDLFNIWVESVEVKKLIDETQKKSNGQLMESQISTS